MGLTGTPTFTNFTATEQNRINATIAAEVNNGATTANTAVNTNGTPGLPSTKSLISQPCN